MDTASIQFVLFGLAAAAVSNFSQPRWWRSSVLFCASLILLILLMPSPAALIPLLGFLLLGYGFISAGYRGWKISALCGVLSIVLAYAWLKKYTFLPEATFLHFTYFTLGLSYIFFRVLHLIVEPPTQTPEHKFNFASYLLYTLNFTTLVSGPIQRYEDFAHDLFAAQPLPLNASIIGLQIERIVRGFF